ncbi:hypothetical protein ACGFMK_04560 [Amycolatopsis sp. NPDC049252]|uniref:hypothetical protein n=1 Tax=Amycolatopsis sp. NPDC049252 TaxID=3363933 RepID=UPI0037114CA2
MAGDILLTRELVWAVSYSAYHWAMDFLAGEVTDAGLRRKITEVHESGVGIFDVTELPAPWRAEILLSLRTRFVDYSAQRLPGPRAGSEGFLAMCRELAELAAKAG